MESGSVFVLPEMARPALSPIEIIKAYKEYFYLGCLVEELSCYNQLTDDYPIRRNVIEMYSKRYHGGNVAFERSFPKETKFDPHLPNIAELMLWWIAYTKFANGYHGMRSLRTPSSTIFSDGVLCVELKTCDSLSIRPSYRSKRTVVKHLT